MVNARGTGMRGRHADRLRLLPTRPCSRGAGVASYVLRRAAADVRDGDVPARGGEAGHGRQAPSHRPRGGSVTLHLPGDCRAESGDETRDDRSDVIGSPAAQGYFAGPSTSADPHGGGPAVFVTQRGTDGMWIVGAGARLHRHHAARAGGGGRRRSFPRLNFRRYAPDASVRAPWTSRLSAKSIPMMLTSSNWMPPPSNGQQVRSTILAHRDAGGRGRPLHRLRPVTATKGQWNQFPSAEIMVVRMLTRRP